MYTESNSGVRNGDFGSYGSEIYSKRKDQADGPIHTWQSRICPGQPAQPALAKWFDSTCFTIPPSYTYGNSGPGILRTDYFGNVSACLCKEFRVTETSRVQFRAEAFNLPNCAYFSGPSTSNDTSTVGRITSTSNSPRQIQFALKHNF